MLLPGFSFWYISIALLAKLTASWIKLWARWVPIPKYFENPATLAWYVFVSIISAPAKTKKKN